MRTVRALLVPAVLVLSACGGSGERACDLLEDVPDRAGQASVEQLEELAEAAQESETGEIREVGERLSGNLARRQVFERLATGSFLDVIQANLDELRRACRDLEATDAGST